MALGTTANTNGTRWVWCIGSLGIAGGVLALVTRQWELLLVCLGLYLGTVLIQQTRKAIGERADTILLVGHGSELGLLSAILGRDAIVGTRTTPRSLKVMRFSTIEDASTRVGSIKCDEAVVADSIEHSTLNLIDARGKSIRPVPAQHLLERVLGRSDVHAVAGPTISLIRNRDRFDVAKRVVDIVTATAMLALLMLPMLVVASILAAFGSVPPIIGRQCVGQGGRAFRMFVFRPFEPALTSEPNTNVTTRAKRISIRLQRILGQSHFDIAPALWNVLVGDMSLIGPRIETAEEHQRNIARFPLHHVRLQCRPGVVSLAQVRFRYSTRSLRDARLALEYDVYYVRHRSAQLDLRIALRASWLLIRDWASTLSLLWTYVRQSWCMGAAALHQRRAVRASTIASVPMPSSGVDEGALKPTLLIGAGAGGRLLARDLRHHRSWGLWPVAFVDDDLSKIGTRIEGIPVLGDTSAIGAIVQREHVEAAVIAIPSASEIEIKRIADTVHGLDVELLTMPNIGTILRGKSAVDLSAVPVTDFLGRSTVAPDLELCDAFLRDKRVLITGAAGSIGQEVARQVAGSTAAVVYGLDINESDLFDLEQELLQKAGTTRFVPIVASVTQSQRLESLFAAIKPDVVFHAAAYKHVPMMEEHPHEAVAVNVAGTLRTARAAAAAGVQRFVLVSTDKAVRPSSVMGATKRLAELVIRDVADQTGMSTCAVRFGNVLGSRGSVIPLFRKQIAAGGPVTVTHPDMMRYFMTIPEAAGLIIQAGAFGDNGVIYMLDMGEEVSIQQLAERMIRLRGLRVGRDIEIRYSGLRPGEKMRESLSLDFETASETPHPKIRILHDTAGGIIVRRVDSVQMVEHLTAIAETGTPVEIRNAIMSQIVSIDGAVYDDIPSEPTESDLIEVEGDLAAVSGHAERQPDLDQRSLDRREEP